MVNFLSQNNLTPDQIYLYWNDCVNLIAQKQKKNLILLLKIFEDISPFCGATDTPVFGLMVMSGKNPPSPCVLCRLRAWLPAKPFWSTHFEI